MHVGAGQKVGVQKVGGQKAVFVKPTEPAPSVAVTLLFLRVCDILSPQFRVDLGLEVRLEVVVDREHVVVEARVVHVAVAMLGEILLVEARNLLVRARRLRERRCEREESCTYMSKRRGRYRESPC